MTANNPSRQQQAVNHGDVELPGQSCLSDTQLEHRLLRRLRPSGARGSFTHVKGVDDFVALGVPSQLFASGAILPTFHFDTSGDRP